MITKEVLDELNEAKQKMGSEWILNLKKIDDDDLYGTRLFATNFSEVLNKFKLVDPKDNYSFKIRCEEFSEYLTQAKNNNWIMKKPELEQLTICAKELDAKREEINKLNEKINILKNTIQDLENQKRGSNRFTSEVEP